VIPLDTFSRREKWARFIADELWRRDPLAFLGIAKEAEGRGTTLLARIRERRAQLQAERRP